MMGLWVMVDDSIQFDELLAGAGAAALAALAAEIAAYQASVRLRIGRDGALIQEALRLPAQLVKDTVTVFAALARTHPPQGEYAEIGVDVPSGEAGQVVATGIRSFTPNTFVVSLSPDRASILVHRLVAPGGKP